MGTNAEAAAIRLGEDQVVRVEGVWTLPNLPALEERLAAFPWPPRSGLVCDGSGVTALDTGGAVLLCRTLSARGDGREPVPVRGLAADHSELLRIISENRARTATATAPQPSRLARLRSVATERGRLTVRGLAFLGEAATVFARLVTRPRTVRWRALLASLERDGFRALPITGLLSFLMGIVIAYQGAEQLRSVGANIFVVDLVGISLLREIAPLVTAILVAGRSGSAYAAEIGTMKVTEELDALRTLGLQPMSVLVLPRVLALVIALPLLTVYADVVGVFGGMLTAAGQLNVTSSEFLTRFDQAVALKHFVIGVGKAPVFAIIIALVGCYQGFQIRGGVDDVGRHTTISVVQSIFGVIVFDAFFSIVLSWWKL